MTLTIASRGNTRTETPRTFTDEEYRRIVAELPTLDSKEEHVSHRLCPIDAGLCGRSHAHGRLTDEAAARSRASSPICYVPRREESLDDCALGAARCGAR
jgi:hypothetical protein